MKIKLSFLVAVLGCTPIFGHAQTPVCGLNNNQNSYIPGTTPSGGSSNYDSFVPPGVGRSYVDPLSGCTITRITNSVADGNQYYIYYSSQTPFSADGHYMLTDNGGSFLIKAGVNFSGVTPGTTIISNIAHGVWDLTNPRVMYYASGRAIHKTTLTGTCTSTSNCSLTDVVLHNYASGSPTYSAISFQDEPDISQDGTTIQFDGQTSGSHIAVDTYNLTNDTTTVVWNTTCTGSLGTQPACLHKIQIDPLNRLIITFNNNGSSGENGEWLTTNPTTRVLIDPNTEHADSGLDMGGTPVYVRTRIDSPNVDPCPPGQWSGSGAHSGSTMAYFTDPLNARNTAVCFLNVNWSGDHFSYRGGPSQPWVTVSFNDGRSPGPEWFTNDSSHYTAPTCTANSVFTTCWHPYESEILLVKINTNMNTAGTAALSTVYRMAQSRSRSGENFWAQVLASNSHDSNYIAFTSNMANHSGCRSAIQSGNGCADVYVISGASGGPLFGNTTSRGGRSRSAYRPDSNRTIKNWSARTSVSLGWVMGRFNLKSLPHQLTLLLSKMGFSGALGHYNKIHLLHLWLEQRVRLILSAIRIL